MNYGLIDDDIKKIKSVLKKIVEIDTAIIFGSRASGTFEKGSDVDIALKGKKITSSTVSRLHYELEEETILPYFFDILDYSSIQEPKLMEHIDQYGKVFYLRGWEERKLEEIAKVQTGPFGSQLHERDYVQEGTPMITVEHLIDDRIKHSKNIPKVSDTDKQRLKKYLLKEGDIVFSRVGSVDRSAYVTNGALSEKTYLRVNK